MSDCIMTIETITFDFTSEHSTLVTIIQHLEGDCPFVVSNVHRKRFPSALSALNILQLLADGTEDYVYWNMEQA